MTTFLKAAAERQPLQIIQDDLHWADRPSLLLLEFLIRELRSSRLLVVGTYRDAEVGRQHPLAPALAEFARQRIGERITLRGLAASEVARFIELTGGLEPPEALVAAVSRKTEGNPFFVAEVVRLLLAEDCLRIGGTSLPGDLPIPPGVREVIGRRLARLSRRCNEVLAVAAVIGRAFSLPALQRASALDSPSLLEALEEAEVARVISALAHSPGRYTFTHALIRETLYEELPVARRLRLHRQVGEALESIAGPDVDEDLTELAHHFVQAAPMGDAVKAITYARRAGERAMTLLAYEEAAGHYERALRASELPGAGEIRQQCELLLALGDSLRKMGEALRAMETFQRAADLARRTEDPQLLAGAALGFEDAVLPAGLARAPSDDPSVRLLEEALSTLGDGESVVKARVLAALARALVFSGAPARGAELSQQAAEVARRVGDPATLAYAMEARRIAIWGPDNPEERLAVVTEIVRLAEVVGAREMALDGRLWRQFVLAEIGDIPAAEVGIEAFARLAEELRQPLYQCYVPLLRASLALLRGQSEQAELLIQQALSLGQRARSQNITTICFAQTLVLRREQGRLGEMETAIEGYVKQFPRVKTFDCVRAVLYRDMGREAEAKRLFERLAANDFADLSRNFVWLLNLACLSEVCAFLDDVRRASMLYQLLLPYATKNVLGSSAGPGWGSVSRYLGILATTLRRWDDAARHFESALNDHARIGARPWLARTQHDNARMLLLRGRAGDRQQAAGLLAQAFETARDLGMASLEAQVLGLAAMHGLPRPIASGRGRSPRRKNGGPGAPAYPDSLTGREVEVLRLLASSKSNREIGEQLILSARTVEHHVASVYAKIGARGRVDATAYAIRHDLIPIRQRPE